MCGLSANPWSPAGDLLAAPVSLAHHGCDGDRRIVVAVANARTGPMRRITRPRTVRPGDPIHARYGFVVTSLSWAPDRRSVTVVASPGLGHD